jgi:hypothetical protein
VFWGAGGNMGRARESGFYLVFLRWMIVSYDTINDTIREGIFR